MNDGKVIPPDDRQLHILRYLDNVRAMVEDVDALDLQGAILVIAVHNKLGLGVAHREIGTNLAQNIGILQVLIERLHEEEQGDGLDDVRYHLAALRAFLVKTYAESFPPVPTIDVPRFEA